MVKNASTHPNHIFNDYTLLLVNDIDASIDYYTGRLGFFLNWRLADEDNQTTLTSIQLGDSEILLGTIDFVELEDRDKLGKGIQLHLALPANGDMEQLYAAAKEEGVYLITELEERDEGEKAFVVHDLDGYNHMIALPSGQTA